MGLKGLRPFHLPLMNYLILAFIAQNYLLYYTAYMKKRENLFRPYWGKRHILIIVIAILVLASAAFCTAKTFLPAFTPLWVALIVAAIVVIVTSFLNMKKQVNISGLRWSVKELISIFCGLLLGIYIVWYLSTILEYTVFLSTAAIIVTGIAGIIAALSLKRTIDTVRPFITLTKTELLLDESLHEGVMRLNIRNTGSTPAEKLIQETLDEQVRTTKGKFILTTISSSISRIEKKR